MTHNLYPNVIVLFAKPLVFITFMHNLYFEGKYYTITLSFENVTHPENACFVIITICDKTQSGHLGEYFITLKCDKLKMSDSLEVRALDSSIAPSKTIFDLTFIENLKAAVGAAIVCGKEQVQEVAAAEQELRHLGPVKGPNQ